MIRRRMRIRAMFFEIGTRSLKSKALVISRDSLDLLVDLGGFSRGAMSLLALKPAPRQAHYLGYASSMGKGLVDYMIADSIVLPPSASKYYGEKIIRMKGCFFPPGDFKGFARRTKRKVGLPSRGFVCARTTPHAQAFNLRFGPVGCEFSK